MSISKSGVRWAGVGRRLLFVGSALVAGLLGTGVAAGGPTNLEETSGLVWVILAVALAGALVTYAFLAYAVWRFRDPATRRRRYG